MTQREMEKRLFLVYLALAGIMAGIFFSQLDHYDPLSTEIGISLMAFLGILVVLGFSHCIGRWMIAGWRRRRR